MIDFHNHVLPNVDDGSNSLEMSLSMLECAANQGITDVINTVHYQHPKVELEDISHERISSKIKILQSKLDENSIPINLHLGAEVFFLPNLNKIKSDPLATFNNFKYMLIEFQVHQLPETHIKHLFDLKMSGVTPIIAHPERYKYIQDDVSIVLDWLKTGCLIQIDAGSPLGLLGKSSKLCSEKIIKNGWAHFLGSDAHDDRKRNFCLYDSFNLIESWIGKDAKSMVYDNPSSLLKGEDIKIDYEYNSKKIPNFLTAFKEKLGIN